MSGKYPGANVFHLLTVRNDDITFLRSLAGEHENKLFSVGSLISSLQSETGVMSMVILLVFVIISTLFIHCIYFCRSGRSNQSLRTHDRRLRFGDFIYQLA